jgi:magnesium-transporting ATPase (P-type)
MQINKKILLTAVLILAVISLAACEQQVTAQMIPGKEFREWFYGRLLSIIVGVVILGILLSIILRRFPVRAPELDTNHQARLVFTGALFSILLIIALGLWIEAYLTHPFGRPISLSNYFSLIFTNTYTFLILVSSAVVFYLVVMLGTRVFYGRRCNCRYALLRKFKRAGEGDKLGRA